MMDQISKAILEEIGIEGMLARAMEQYAGMLQACAALMAAIGGQNDGGIAEMTDVLAKCSGGAALYTDLLMDSLFTGAQHRAHWERYTELYDGLQDMIGGGAEQ